MASLQADGTLLLSFHPGQLRAWDSAKRIVAMVAGFQSGKTEFSMYWLYREIKTCGPGDYLYVSASYKLMSRKALPAFLHLFHDLLGLGDYNGKDSVFCFSRRGMEKAHGEAGRDAPPTKVFFGHAADPDSLESATARAAVLDEAGQKRFRLGSWQAVLRRLARHQGRILICTTPYDMGWLKREVFDVWRAEGDRANIEYINFGTQDNPAIPREVIDEQRRRLPGWRYRMTVLGLFERPAGLIYDCFSQSRHCEPRTLLPENWPRVVGLDFGAVNTAALHLAKRLHPVTRAPTGQWVVYREHHPAEKMATSDHAHAILRGEPRMPTVVGGAKSEDDWRAKFRACGLPVRLPPVFSVDAGIDTVYAMIQTGELVIMEDLHELIDELETYSRVVDDEGAVGEAIDDDSAYHLLACLRYACLWIKRGGALLPSSHRDDNRTMMADAPV